MAPRVFIGVGSNLLDPQAQVIRALALLDREAGISLVVHSRLYRTSPWGRLEQPVFVNAVAEVRALQRPSELLELLKDLESRLGRSSGRVPWGPRIIDLDLLAFGEERLTEPSLQVPHPRLAERRFVLAPWAEIAPDFEVPGLGTVAALLAACSDAGMVETLEGRDGEPPASQGAG